jgi:hypothetical protein
MDDFSHNCANKTSVMKGPKGRSNCPNYKNQANNEIHIYVVSCVGLLFQVEKLMSQLGDSQESGTWITHPEPHQQNGASTKSLWKQCAKYDHSLKPKKDFSLSWLNYTNLIGLPVVLISVQDRKMIKSTNVLHVHAEATEV